MTITTSLATSDRWTDAVTAFGRRGDDPNGCWCQRFMEPRFDGVRASSNRDALRREIDGELRSYTQIIGLDVSDADATAFAESFGALPSVEYLQADAAEMPFADDSFFEC